MINDEPRRILHVLGQMYRAGAESRTMDLYRHIDRRTVQFDFLVTKPGEHHYFPEIRELGGRIFYLDPPRKSNPIKFVYELQQLLAREGPFFAVHAHTQFNAGVVLLAAHLARVPQRVAHSRSAPPRRRHPVRAAYAFVMRRLILTNATLLLACGREAGAFLFGDRAVRRGEVQLLPNAIELKRFASVSRQLIRGNLAIQEDEIVIGHVGTFRPVKNHRFLLDTFDAFHQECPRSRLVLVGDGPTREDIESAVRDAGLSDAVMILGQRDVTTVLASFDIFVMPSLYEGVPGSAIEAQASGIRCLLSRNIANDVDCGTGLVRFETLSSGANHWAQLISQMLAEPAPTRAHAQEALRDAGYDAQDSAKRLCTLYGIDAPPTLATQP